MQVRCCLQCQIKMNLVFRISKDGSEVWPSRSFLIIFYDKKINVVFAKKYRIVSTHVSASEILQGNFNGVINLLLVCHGIIWCHIWYRVLVFFNCRRIFSNDVLVMLLVQNVSM